MPIRNLLRDVAKLDQFRANGTIEGVHKVTMPVSGCPAKERTLRTERDDESLVIETVGSYSTQVCILLTAQDEDICMNELTTQWVAHSSSSAVERIVHTVWAIPMDLM